jgi:hypothetical protein
VASHTTPAQVSHASIPRELARALSRLSAEVLSVERHRARAYVIAEAPGEPLFARFTSDAADEAVLAHEATVREAIGSGVALRAPPVIAHGSRWMIERRIDPAPPRGAAVDRAVEAAAELADLSLPAIPRRGSAFLRPAKWRRAIRMARSPLSVGEIRHARRLLAGSSLPRVTTHGDFHAGNLLGGDDGPWVVDWELSGRGPAGADLIRLWTTLDDDQDRARLFESTVELVGRARRRDLLLLRYALLVQTLIDKLESPGVGGQGPDRATLLGWLSRARREARLAT